MMVNRISYLVLAIALFTSCSKKAPGFAQYIPKDASTVISIDVKSMMVKLEKDGLSFESMAAALKDSSNEKDIMNALSIWGDFKNAGIDLDNNILIAMTQTSIIPQFEMVAGLKDTKKFEDFIAKQKEAKPIVKGDGFSYSGDDNSIIGWNKEAVIALNGNRNNYNFDLGKDDVIGKAPSAETAVSLIDQLKKLFKQTKAESIVSTKGFDKMSAKKGDIVMFGNSSAGLNNPQTAQALLMVPKVKELIEDAYSVSAINFNDGKALIEGDSYFNSKLSDLLKKYSGPTTDLSLLENYPSQNVNGAMYFSFKPEIIPALAEATGTDGLANMVLGQSKTNLKEIVAAFKGDIAVAFSDFSMAAPPADAGMYEEPKPKGNMLFVAKIGDKAAFDKLINMSVATGEITRDGNKLVPKVNDPDMPFTIAIEGDKFIVATAEAYTGYMAKSSKIGLNESVVSKLKGKSTAGYIDIEKILNGIPEALFSSEGIEKKNVMTKAKSTFKTAWFNTDNFSGDKMHGEGEIVFGDASKNSLCQMVRFGLYAAEQMKAEKARNKSAWDEIDALVDSNATRIPPPPPPPAKK